MKALSPDVDTRRFASTQNVAWLLDVDGPGLALRASSRPLEFDGNLYESALLETPDWRMESRSPFGPGGAIVTRATVRVADAMMAAGSLAATLLRASAAEFSATLRLIWLEDDDSADPSDAVVMLAGGMASFVREAGAVRLELADPLSLRDDRRVLREFDRLEEKPVHAAPPHPLAGRPLPVVFGTHDRLRLRPWELGPETELAAPLAIDDDQAFVVSLSGFPASGVAQIGDELVQYDAVDPLGPALGTGAEPIVRLETPVPHGAGEAVRGRPAGGFTWLVADHVCETVTDARAGGEPIDPGAVSAETRPVDGRTLQLLRLDRIPAGSITARVEGWRLGGGGVAENPADVLEILLTDPRFAALDPAWIEMGSFVPIRNDLAAGGFAFARVLDSASTSPGALIDAAAREAAVWVRSYNPEISFARADPIPPLTPAASLDESTALEPGAAAAALPEPAPLPSGLLLERARPTADPPAGPFFRAFDPPPGASNQDNPPLRRTLRWLDARSLSALEDLARRLTPPLADARTEARHRFLLAHAMLEPGDPVDLSRESLGLAGDGLFVQKVETAGPGSIRLHLAGPLAGPPCFSATASDPMASVVQRSFVRPFGGGRRLLIALNGNYVARLAWNGGFSLGGELTETGPLTFVPSWDPAEGPIAIHDPDGAPGPDDRLVFAAGEMGSFEPFFSFAENEPAQTGATLVENVALPPSPPALSDCVLADPAGFTLFPHPSAAALHFDKTTNELRLAGELVEGATLDGL